MIEIFVDADGCPVKDETYVVATRHGVPVTLVANAHLAVPPGMGVELVVVGREPDAADRIVRDGDIMHWIGWADRIETMTSLAGFEALIRDKPVGVHGMPFYAGWGLTDDRHPIVRRTRRRILTCVMPRC